ncbi:hypothetical protein [Catenuloplanes indicus]|uniref:Uncharacterized protein n=1 Tax=Catenuloplanes indicus TaxID=137267 RepID=A0AAE3VUD4_9ACTN|nr:hypothetical protein [Catenuloplanes indicus]
MSDARAAGPLAGDSIVVRVIGEGRPADAVHGGGQVVGGSREPADGLQPR